MAQAHKHYFSAVIADDHQIVRSGLKMALEAPDMVSGRPIKVVAEAENGLEAIEQVKAKQPDLLLLDVSMPMASGAEILADIRRWSPDTRIVVLTAVTSTGLLSSLVESGVDGLFSKGSNQDELFAKLPLILAGGRHIETTLVALLNDAVPMAKLTQRERQSLNMIVAGRTNGEIAELMGVSPKTAEKHRGSLMAKLGVNSMAGLMAKALREGLIEEHGHL